ncbi:zinc-binding dehydrogenase [bacterium]|nr:zinc-binding dehydrogenase [bacterium]
MRAIVVDGPGGLEALSYRTDLETPQPGPGQVRVRTAYAGVNFFDTLIRSGRYGRKPKYPIILGGELSGWVDALGEGVEGLSIGQPVSALTGDSGCYADFALAPAGSVIPIPDGMDMKLAAAWPLQWLTAWGVLYASGKARSGDWVLVHAAAGGVGQALTQMASRSGCRVIATAGSQEKCDFALAHGAEFAINYREKEFGREARAITGGRGVDIICDSVGAANVIGNLRAICFFGLIVVFGYASGEPEYDERLLWGRSCGVAMNGLYHLVERTELLSRGVSEMLPGLSDGSFRLHIHSVQPLAEAAQAHAALEGRETIGKLLLEVNPA